HWLALESGTSPVPNPAHVSLAKVLLAAGADVNLADDIGRTPLHLVMHNPALMAHFLAGGRAKVNNAWPDGWTQLTAAASHEAFADSIPLLLAAGADPRKPDREGRLPLDVAVKNNNGRAAVYLRDALEKPPIK
ncbi:MAG: ankyrin repeat domain-containing protein, partial [Desulfovibrio sp.]|nr:ankyrin repeat domain-containing protein [Desulfovibrio sp.]